MIAADGQLQIVRRDAGEQVYIGADGEMRADGADQQRLQSWIGGASQRGAGRCAPPAG
jgi:hypothetical protein